MIVVIRPGGTIKDVSVVLRHNELLPNRHNTKEAIVYREGEVNPREWTLVKPKFSILPQDSPLLSQPEIPEFDISTLTVDDSPESLYEHVDIIRFDEEEKKT